MLPVLRPALSVSPEYAEGYFANRLHADAWISASEADKEKALSWSAAVIENACV